MSDTRVVVIDPPVNPWSVPWRRQVVAFGWVVLVAALTVHLAILVCGLTALVGGWAILSVRTLSAPALSDTEGDD